MQSKIEFHYHSNGNLERLLFGENNDSLFQGQVGCAVYGVDGEGYLPSDQLFINFVRPDGKTQTQLMSYDKRFFYTSNGWETELTGNLLISFTRRRYSTVDPTRWQDQTTESHTEQVHATAGYTPLTLSSDTQSAIMAALAAQNLAIDDLTRIQALAHILPHGFEATAEIVKIEQPDGRIQYVLSLGIPEGSPGITLPGTANMSGRTTLPITPGMWEGTEAPFSMTLTQEQHKMGNNALTVSAQIDRGGGLLDVMPLKAVRDTSDFSVTVYSNERFGGMLMFDGGVAENGQDGKSAYQAAQEGGYVGAEASFNEGLAKAPEAIHIAEEATQAIIEETQRAIAAEVSLSQRISAQEGLGGALAAHDFGTANPTQNALTAYARQQIPSIGDDIEIWNATHVTNLFDNSVWQLNNTQNTVPEIFEWVNIGSAQVAQATQETLGTVKGSPSVGVNAQGQVYTTPAMAGTYSREEIDAALDTKGGGSSSTTLTVGFTDDCDYKITGTADHQNFIKTAIAALPQNGGKIILREGTYNITDYIGINKANVTLEGMGSSTVIRRMKTFPYGLILMVEDYCKVQNCRIDGNKGSYSAGTNRGIQITGQHNSVTGNSIVDNDRGIYIENDGIGNGFNIISENIGNGNNRGINLISGSNNISGNTFSSGGYGVFVEKGSLNLISGNNCRNNDNHGIYLARGNNNVTGNNCNGNKKVGIYVESSNNTVAGNSCYNNSTDGVYINGDNNTITGNTAYGNNTGIKTAETSNHNLIVGNQIFGNTVAIDDFGADTLIQANKGAAGESKPEPEVTITTQAEFDELIASPDWKGAQSVIIAGAVTASTNVTIPANVGRIKGAGTGKLTIAGYLIGHIKCDLIEFSFEGDDIYYFRTVKSCTIKGRVSAKNVEDCDITVDFESDGTNYVVAADNIIGNNIRGTLSGGGKAIFDAQDYIVYAKNNSVYITWTGMLFLCGDRVQRIIHEGGNYQLYATGDENANLFLCSGSGTQYNFTNTDVNIAASGSFTQMLYVVSGATYGNGVVFGSNFDIGHMNGQCMIMLFITQEGELAVENSNFTVGAGSGMVRVLTGAKVVNSSIYMWGDAPSQTGILDSQVTGTKVFCSSSGAIGFDNCQGITNCNSEIYSGIAYNNCSYASSCRGYGSTAIWGGTTYKRDDDSCDLD